MASPAAAAPTPLHPLGIQFGQQNFSHVILVILVLCLHFASECTVSLICTYLQFFHSWPGAKSSRWSNSCWVGLDWDMQSFWHQFRACQCDCSTWAGLQRSLQHYICRRATHQCPWDWRKGVLAEQAHICCPWILLWWTGYRYVCMYIICSFHSSYFTAENSRTNSRIKEIRITSRIESKSIYKHKFQCLAAIQTRSKLLS